MVRDESVNLLSFNGQLIHKHPARPEPGRIYRIEIAQFPDGSPKTDRRYERDGESVMARYGFQVDYVLDIDPTSSAERKFDLVKISSFPSNTQRAAFENDPLHRHRAGAPSRRGRRSHLDRRHISLSHPALITRTTYIKANLATSLAIMTGQPLALP